MNHEAMAISGANKTPLWTLVSGISRVPAHRQRARRLRKAETLRVSPGSNDGEPSANAASAPPPSTAGLTLCRRTPPATPSWSTGSPSRPSTPKGSALTTTAWLRISRSHPTPSPNWPPAAAPGGSSKTRPSTRSRPTVKSRTQLWARQENPRQHPSHPQSARLRIPHRCLPRRPRMANRRHRPWSHVSLLRASADHHRLRRLPGLAPSAPIHHGGSHTATLTTRLPVPHKTHSDKEFKTPEIPAKPKFRIAGEVLVV